MSLREMFRAMQQGRGWLSTSEVESRIADLQLGSTPAWDGELVELLRVMESRMQPVERETCPSCGKEHNRQCDDGWHI